jgi:predicted nucleotidyltransferase
MSAKVIEDINIKKNLENVLNAIRNTVNVKKIYLFGSYADNTQKKDSDLDLCIVTSLDCARKIDIIRKIRKLMLHNVNMPVDLLVYDEHEFAERAILKAAMEYKIIQKGVILYEQ